MCIQGETENVREGETAREDEREREIARVGEREIVNMHEARHGSS